MSNVRSVIVLSSSSALRSGAAEVAESFNHCSPGPLLARYEDGVDLNRIPAELIGDSPGMLAAFKTMARVADSGAAVLIKGEPGTGKVLLARLLHEHSARRERPFVIVDCAALPLQLLESELFGVEGIGPDGAAEVQQGRFESASGGTLFLDKVDEAPPSLQAKIICAIEEREIERVGSERRIPIDVRILAAATRDLGGEVEAGRFREDLYYQLTVVVISLPPLRDRGDDVRLLAEHFVGRFAREHDRQAFAIAQETLSLLMAHPWPDNVPQLRTVLEQAVMAADGAVLLPTHLPEAMREAPVAYSRRQREQPALLSLEELERRHIQQVLSATGGHLGRAAEALGIHRNTLRRKLVEHGLTADESLGSTPPDGVRRLDDEPWSSGADAGRRGKGSEPRSGREGSGRARSRSRERKDPGEVRH